MGAIIGLLDMAIAALRTGLNIVLVASLLAATLAWLVRTRKVSPFSALARFSRSALDPLIDPIERRIVRSGGTTASAPWWALIFVLLGGVSVLFALGFVRNTLAGILRAFSSGLGGIVGLAIAATFGVLQLALLARIVMSWIGGSHSAAGRLAFTLTEWFLRPLRQVIPPFSGVDITPLIAWFALSLLEGMIGRVL